MAVKRVLAALLALAVVLHLAGSVLAAATFVAFVAAFLIPAVLLISRAPHIRDLPDDVRLIASAIVFVLLSAPLFFLRKAIGMPLAFDAVTCAVLIALAIRRLKTSNLELQTSYFAIAIAFSLVWLGYAVPHGADIRFYGLFAIDFGNLVSAVSALRASPMLPLAYVDGTGPFSYHWLYFTLPATLADFLGMRMPNANALILTNLLAALLFAHTLATIARNAWAAAVVMFAPFTVYAYQVAAARFELGWLELPARNHLLLSPINSMIVFGNNTIALVLALFALAMLARWNEEGKLGDALLGVIALAAIIGYSITLVFPLTGALLIWTLMGRVRRPLIVLPLAALTGAAALALFRAIDVIGGETSRRLTFDFDGGAFLRMALLGMIPLWGLLILAGRQSLTLHHVLIAVALAVPTCLFIDGSPTGQVDFSMKTASLIAVAFTPLIAPALRIDRRRVRWLALALVVFGAAHTAAYVLQFSWYRMNGRGRGESLPRAYYDALVWIREHTSTDTVVIDPTSIPRATALYPMMIAERRVWLPTLYTESILVGRTDPAIGLRIPDWQLRARPVADVALLMSRCEDASPWWKTEKQFGRYSICVRRR